MFSKISSALEKRVLTTGFRLSAGYTLALLIMSLGVAGAAYALLVSSLRSDDRAEVAAEFQLLRSEYAGKGLKRFGHDGRFAAAGDLPFYVRVLSNEGRKIFVSDGGPYIHFSPPRTRPSSAEPEWEIVKAGGGSGDSLELLTGPLPDGNILQVGKTTAWRRKFLVKFQNTASVVILVAVILAFICALFLTDHALQPLRNLIEAVKAIKGGDLSARVPLRGTGDELDELGLLFNGMLDRISTLLSGMREALDNVAHDLRTPLTRLRAVAETALAESDSPEKRGEALSDCLEETEQVLTLLNSLMELSEADAGALKLNRTMVRLAEVVNEAMEIYRDVAEARQLKFSARLDPNVVAFCDRTRIRQALGNLLDNAVKFSPPGSNITVTVVRDWNRASIRVADQGPGIPEADLPRIWDRLYRGDSSRHEKGLGLGLSIVRAVANAHGGSATVELPPGGGSVFEISIPLSSR